MSKKKKDSVRKKVQKTKTVLWKVLRRLTKMKPHEDALVPFGANQRVFAVRKEMKSMALPKIEELEKAVGLLQKIVKVCKSGTPDASATESLEGQLDEIGTLLLPGIPVDIERIPNGDRPKELVRLLKELNVAAGSHDIGVADQADRALELAEGIFADAASPPPVDTEPEADPEPQPEPDPEPKPEPEGDPAPDPTPEPDLEPAPDLEPDEDSDKSIEEEEDAAVKAALEAATGDDVDVEKGLPEVGKPGGHKSAPKGYPEDASLYADPNNFKYPLDTEKRIRRAMSRLSNDDNASIYTADELSTMWGRIKAAAKKFDIEVSEETGVNKSADRLSAVEAALSSVADSVKKLTEALPKTIDERINKALPAGSGLSRLDRAPVSRTVDDVDPLADSMDIASPEAIASLDINTGEFTS